MGRECWARKYIDTLQEMILPALYAGWTGMLRVIVDKDLMFGSRRKYKIWKDCMIMY